jgi:hypothetical protein
VKTSDRLPVRLCKGPGMSQGVSNRELGRSRRRYPLLVQAIQNLSNAGFRGHVRLKQCGADL